VSGYRGIAYDQNRGLDANNDGSITKAEAAAKARMHRISRTTPSLQLPGTNNSINVPMPSMPQVDIQGATQSVLDTLGNAGNTLNTFITHRFLNNL